MKALPSMIVAALGWAGALTGLGSEPAAADSAVLKPSATRIEAPVSSSPVDASNRAFAEVVELLTPLAPPAAAGRDAVALAEFRQRQAERFVTAADKAKAFAAANPGHAQAAEARWLEAKARLQAAMAGEAKQADLAGALVNSVRKDGTLPANARLELAAFADVVLLRAKATDREDFLAAQEEALRRLIAEFPEETGGYERLLRFAENHYDDAAAVRIAKDVAGMSAPGGIAAAAETIVARHNLVGQSLRAIALQTLGEGNAISAAADRGVILYTWSSTAPGTLSLGQALAREAPAGTLVVGLNVDSDPAVAAKTAEAAQLPGALIYDARGYEGALAQGLKLRRLGEVIIADRQGLIRTVSGRRGDLTAKLNQAGQ